MEQSLSADKTQAGRVIDLWGKEFWLLLSYSLLPGIYKVAENQLLMLLCIPIIFYLIYNNRRKIHLWQVDSFFLLYVLYIILHSVIWFFFPITNSMGIAMGIFMNVLPMGGYYWAKSIDFESFSRIIIKIIIVHCIIGIILYPPFQLVSQDNPLILPLKEGVVFGRMASVSGSLGFGNLLMIGFILAFFFDKKILPLFFFCLMFSSQRSAWVGASFALFIYLLSLMKAGKLKHLFVYILLLISSLLFLLYFIEHFLNIDLSFVFLRFSEMGDASSERSDQWRSGLSNFLSYPLGTGLGQVGQIASRAEGAESIFTIVPDGDYFRILSESGIAGGIFYLIVIFLFLFLLLYLKLNSIKSQAIMSLVGANLIQMIGSNISEFYFTNLLYWAVFGFFFLQVKSSLVINRIVE